MSGPGDTSAAKPSSPIKDRNAIWWLLCQEMDVKEGWVGDIDAQPLLYDLLPLLIHKAAALEGWERHCGELADKLDKLERHCEELTDKLDTLTKVGSETA